MIHKQEAIIAKYTHFRKCSFSKENFSSVAVAAAETHPGYPCMQHWTRHGYPLESRKNFQCYTIALAAIGSWLTMNLSFKTDRGFFFHFLEAVSHFGKTFQKRKYLTFMFLTGKCLIKQYSYWRVEYRSNQYNYSLLVLCPSVLMPFWPISLLPI